MKTFYNVLIGFAVCTIIFGACFAAYIHFSEKASVEPVHYETEPPANELPPAQLPANLALPGEWYWLGVPYYIFDEDGTGARNNGAAWQELDWWIRDGVLFVCDSPDSCRGNCAEPSKWYYQFDGDELTLTYTLSDEWVFTYTRR